MNSKNYKKFKNRVGQANHFLITTLIGLDAVKMGAKKPIDFDASWNPKNVDNSVARSREYVINSSLAWLVDNVDMYFRLCNKKPKLFNTDESKAIDSTKHSVYKKFKCVLELYNDLPKNQVAFVDLLICWRNNLMHYEADNKLLDSSELYFKQDILKDNDILKYHLDAKQMMQRFNDKKTPKFKEIATITSMTINFINSMDLALTSKLNKREYVRQFLELAYKNDELVFLRNVTDETERCKKIKQYLFTSGITDEFVNVVSDYILKLSRLAYKELVDELTKVE